MSRLRRRLAVLADSRSDEGGYIAILVAVVVSSGFLFSMAAISVDTSRWYDERARVQKAADAAALAGVPFLPYDLVNAQLRAKEVAKRNGYDDALADVVVDVRQGALASQLVVTISSRIDNQFGSLIGVEQANISMTATADYKGPAPMGSPCNTFGNEPNPGTNASSPTPAGTAQGASPFTNCSRVPQFWATIEGPETGKLQGDRYQTRGCEATDAGASAGVDGCTGSGWQTNTEYDEFGYVFTVKVQQPAVNKTIDLQLYDPTFAPVGQRCENLPDTGSFANNTNPTNPYTRNNDARNRYARNGSTGGTTSASFCPGDSFAGAGSGASPKRAVTTSFVLRQQVDSLDPKLAPLQNDTSGNPCIRQYAPIYNATTAPNANTFIAGASGYNADLVKYFHNWAPMCSFVPTRAGDYYIQVRTNVSLGSGSGYERSGNAAAAALTGNTSQGEGSNGFAIRAVIQAGLEKEVAVSGYNHMPIFVNANTASPIFNLIRVLPGAAGQSISFSYFDAGDAASNGSVQVLPPTDATGSITSTPFPGAGCKAVGGSAGAGQNLTNCTAPFEQSGGYSRNNGKTETITIPIPSDYNCNYLSFGGCWYRVQVGFGTGTVNDVTTWDATIIGDPVRLIK